MPQCPYCLVVGMENDPTCYKCGRPFNPGITQRGLSTLMALIFAGTMLAAILLVVPMKWSLIDWVASAITTGLFVAGAGVVGSIVGWIVGAFVCKC